MSRSLECSVLVYKNGERQPNCEGRYFNTESGLGYGDGVIEDGPLVVSCVTMGLPNVFFNGARVDIKQINSLIDLYSYQPFDLEIGGYKLHFESGFAVEEPYSIDVDTPSGDHWVCEYDNDFGGNLV